jgi:hypothetical protein
VSITTSTLDVCVVDQIWKLTADAQAAGWSRNDIAMALWMEAIRLSPANADETAMLARRLVREAALLNPGATRDALRLRKLLDE